MRKILVLLACVVSVGLWGQMPEFEWVAGQGGVGIDWGNAIATDTFGNVYTTGSFRNNATQSDTSDFDPGLDFYGLFSNGAADIFVSKLNPEGELIWAVSFGGYESDRGYAIATDASGNVYVTGLFNWTVDFDPGPGVYNLTASFSNNSSVFVLKLDTNGSFIWARELGDYSSGGSSGSSWGEGIAVDEDGNVYTTGRARENSDFDPGSDEYLLTTNTNSSNAFISKLDSYGDFVWAKVIGGEDAFGTGNELALDENNNIYVTGIFQGEIDFDPGPNEFNMLAMGNGDMYVLKISENGDFIWANATGGASTYVRGKDLVIDEQGYVYTTGGLIGTADFDPGTGIYEISSGTEEHTFISKLEGNGSFVWAKAVDGLNNMGHGITLDSHNNVYITGDFLDTTDFDPGPDVFTLFANNKDPFILKLDKDGNFIWAGSFVGYEEGFFNVGHGEGIVLDRWNNIYTTGSFRDSTDFEPDTTVYHLLTNGGKDIFVHKMRQPCSVGLIINSDTDNFTICNGDSVALSVATTIALEGLSYHWNTGDSTDSIVVAPDTSLSVSVFVNYSSNNNSCSFSDTVLLTVLEKIDTTYLEMMTCDSTKVGLQNLTYASVNNCDSTVVVTSNYLATPSSPNLPTTTLVIPENASPFMVNIPEVSNANSYEWTVPSGVDILSGQGTTSVVVDWEQASSGEICVRALNECGASADTCLQVTVDITDAISEISRGNYKIFPNPSSGQLNIIFSDQQQYEIRLFNTIGQQVKHYEDTREKVILSVGHLPSGLYWLLIDCTSCTDKRSVLYKETVEILH